MNGHIPEKLWNSVEFLTLPEDGWKKNLISHLKYVLKWDLNKTNQFIKWIMLPEKKFLNDTQTLNFLKKKLINTDHNLKLFLL